MAARSVRLRPSQAPPTVQVLSSARPQSPVRQVRELGPECSNRLIAPHSGSAGSRSGHLTYHSPIRYPVPGLAPAPGCYRLCLELPPAPDPRTEELRAPAHLLQRWRPSLFREPVPSPYGTLVAPRSRSLFRRSRRLPRSVGP